MLRASFALLLAVALALALHSGSVALIGGAPDGNRHPYVAVISTADGGQCGGSAISARVVITAGHCYPDETRVIVSFGEDASAIGAQFVPGVLHQHPLFCEVCADSSSPFQVFDAADVAVVILDAPVDLVRYASLPEPRLIDRLPNGARLDLVGYGLIGFGPQPKRVVADGPLRLTAEAELLPSEHRLIDRYIKVSSNPAHEQGAFCLGDSGGPALQARTDTILAVGSFEIGFCNAPSYFYRLDTAEALDFIGSVVADIQ